MVKAARPFLLVEAVQQLARLDTEAVRQPQDRPQPRLASAPLDPADAGGVDTRGVGQVVLRDSFSRPQFAHAVAEGATGAVMVVVESGGHSSEA